VGGDGGRGAFIGTDMNRKPIGAWRMGQLQLRGGESITAEELGRAVGEYMKRWEMDLAGGGRPGDRGSGGEEVTGRFGYEWI